ncbi:MAG: hypothetical protein JNM99_24530 [Verrucomicrobiaceae bacterium]|nr:hypothetical protein [Verrucomicrobiaceae bacterium]
MAYVAMQFCTVVGTAWAQAPGDLEVNEMRLNLAASVDRVQNLQSQLDLTRRQVTALTDTVTRLQTQLTSAKGELVGAESKLEASSLAAGTGSDSGSKEKVLGLLRDLKESKDQLSMLTSKFDELRNAASSTGNLDVKVRDILSRVDATVEPRLGDLGVTRNSSERISCIAFNPGLGIGVISSGSGSGLRNGLTMVLKRRDSVVARATVVDARTAVSGVVVTEILAKGAELGGVEGLTAEIDQELKR